MNFGSQIYNIFLHKLTTVSELTLKKLDRINPIGQCTTPFLMPQFPPTPIEAILICT